MALEGGTYASAMCPCSFHYLLCAKRDPMGPKAPKPYLDAHDAPA
jgi:hypothetical protein